MEGIITRIEKRKKLKKTPERNTKRPPFGKSQAE
jgi:hypothetical protein